MIGRIAAGVLMLWVLWQVQRFVRVSAQGGGGCVGFVCAILAVLLGTALVVGLVVLGRAAVH
jgi:hypothetical protein